MYRTQSVTVVIPALNEEPSIAKVINELSELNVCAVCGSADQHYLSKENKLLSKMGADAHCESCQCESARVSLVDNIVMCDNGSTDNTADIARTHGVIVVEEQEKGYGAACLKALRYPLENDLIVFVDGDHSVVCAEMPELLDPLFAGADLVIGSRTLGSCEAGALTVPQVTGNRVASALMRLIWKKQVTDLGPFRAISRETLEELQMKDRQFGWTVEMQVRSLQLKKQIVEVPVTTRKRIGQSKVSGTFSGVFGASKGILGTIGKLYWRELAARFKGSSKTSTNGHLAATIREKRNTL